MKKISLFGKALICCGLVLSVFGLGNRFTTQPVQAAATSPCSATNLHAGLIATNETWCAGGDNIHYMTGDVTVQAGVTLTIAAGVTVDSPAANWWQYLIIRGHLDIQGTLAHPVVLTRSNPEAPWAGIYFDGSAGGGSGTINYATIEKAGSNLLPSGCTGACGDAQTALFVKDLPSGKQVTINNSTIHNNVGKGLYVVNSVVNVNQTTFSQNHYPIWIEDANSVISYSGNTFVNNTFGYPNTNYPMPLNAIAIGPNALMGHDFSLPPQTGLDAYIFPSGTTLPAGRTVTVQPGVTVRTGEGFFTVKGHLDAIGSQLLPIRFSGIPHADDLTNIYVWGGLIFDGPSGASGHLDHAIVEHGCQVWEGHGCATLMIYTLAANKSVIVEHSTLQNSGDMNLAVINSPTAQVDNNLIKGGRYGVYLATNLTVRNLAIIDQVLDGVYVETGYSVDARHLTIARAGRNGFYVNTGGTGALKNSILSHNALAVKAEGSGQANLNTNLSDTNTAFKSGTVTELGTLNGSAAFEADGYHIQSSSAAVGMGQRGLCVVDIDGNPRPSPTGSIPDLGADEIAAGKFKLFMPNIIR